MVSYEDLVIKYTSCIFDETNLRRLVGTAGYHAPKVTCEGGC